MRAKKVEKFMQTQDITQVKHDHIKHIQNKLNQMLSNTTLNPTQPNDPIQHIHQETLALF